MKANELFTGALVRVNRDGLCIKKDTIVEVRGGDADDKLIEKGLVGSAHCHPLDENQFAGGIWCEYLDPIPLTPEILEKNGWKHEFDKTDYMVKYDLAQKGEYCWMMWATREHNLDIQRQDKKLYMYNLKVQRVCIPCDYVHQLQHAMRLCGIEKEIEL